MVRRRHPCIQSGINTLEMLNDSEYEDCYREALLLVTERVAHVRAPIVIKGERIVIVEGVPLNDHDILNLGWGYYVAAEIERERDAFKRMTAACAGSDKTI